MQEKNVCLDGKLVADYTFTDARDHKNNRSFIPEEDQKRFDEIYHGLAIMPEVYFPRSGSGVGGSQSSGSSSGVAGSSTSTTFGSGLDGNSSTKQCPPGSSDSAGSSASATAPIPADPNAPTILVKITCQTGLLRGEAHYHHLFVPSGNKKISLPPRKLKKTPLISHGFAPKLSMTWILFDAMNTLEKIYDPEMLFLNRWRGFKKVGGGEEIFGATTIGEVSEGLEAWKALVLVPVIGKEKENKVPGFKNGESTHSPDYTNSKEKLAISNQPLQRGILHEYPDSEDKIMGENYESLFWGINGTTADATASTTQQEVAGDLPVFGPDELPPAPPAVDPNVLAVLEPFEVLFGGPGFGLDMII